MDTFLVKLCECECQDKNLNGNKWVIINLIKHHLEHLYSVSLHVWTLNSTRILLVTT